MSDSRETIAISILQETITSLEAERERLVQENLALSQRCVVLAAESASFEARWREIGESYTAERTLRQLAEYQVRVHIEAVEDPIEPSQEPAEGLP